MVAAAPLLLLVLLQAEPPELSALRPEPGHRIHLSAPIDPATSSDAPSRMRPDAADALLADVCFVDAHSGWAVGDHGTIWHTADGGSHWEHQSSGVQESLTSVSFVDDRIGWAAGGYCHPYTHTTSGILLSTRDGGEHWQRDSSLLLPALREVRFWTEREGWAMACSSAMYPAGAFITRDGGRSWVPPCTTRSDGWRSADFLDPRTAILAGRNGELELLDHGEAVRSSLPGIGLQGIGRVKLVPPTYGWAVGDGGLVAMTIDSGRTWSAAPGALPPGSEIFDFAALAVRSGKCWIAGSPGSRIFQTSDAGRTWTASPTGTPLPIRALQFVDDRHGRAVGDLGLILATSDGGHTWSRQRAGGTRVALLGIFGQSEDVPFELLAKSCADDGYLSWIDILGRRDVESPPLDEAPASDRFQQAVLAVGGCGAETAWRFPLRQAGLKLSIEQILDGWNRANQGRGKEAAIAYIVRQIRTYRPGVVVTQEAAGYPDSSLAAIVHRTVLGAVERAGDPGFASEQIQLAGLEPWQVKRVYAVSPSATPGEIEFRTDQLAARSGRTLVDMAESARRLADDHADAPQAFGIREELEVSVSRNEHGTIAAAKVALPGKPDSSRMSIAIDLSSEVDARRPVDEMPPADPELARGIAQRRRHSQAILERFERDPQAALRILAKTDDLTRGLEPADAAAFLYRIGDRYRHTGHWDMAAEVFASLVDRFPDDPLCRSSLLWLMQYYSASECPGPEPTEFGPNRLELATILGRELEHAHPDLFASPAIRYPLASVYRRLGQARQVDRLYLADRNDSRPNAWSNCARAEAWLEKRIGPSPKPLFVARIAPERPRLDGKLDKAVWKQASPAILSSTLNDDDAWPGTVKFSYDAEFLYIAIQCRQTPGVKYDSRAVARPRDPDLSDHDRVDIFLDLDRTYATYYHLTVDHRGWADDSACDDRSWNPNWYIAARTADDTWCAEAAIPLQELKTKITRGRTVWAVGIQRTVPGVGFQSWSTPAATDVRPEGFGYLSFE